MYSSHNIIRVIKSRRMRYAGYIARTGDRRGAYRVLVGRPVGNGPLGRPTCRWQDNTMNLQEVEWRGMDWFDVVQYRYD